MPRRYIIAVLMVMSLIAAGIFVLADPWTNGDDNSPHVNADELAPEPALPLNDSYFVDPTLTLTWAWPMGLGANQAYAVRVWYGADESDFREVWVDTPSFDATDAINSFLHDLGDFYWQVAVINMQSGGGFASMGSQWSPVQTLHRVRHISPPPIPAEQRSAAAQLIMASNPADATALIDAARHFVSTNAIYNNPDRDFAPDYSDALDMMAEHVTNDGEMPRLVCDGVSTAMLTLLAEFGIDSHVIFLYADDSGQIGEHTVLEVFNPDTQLWEVHEPSSDRYMVDENGDRASIERLVFGNLSITSVCDTDNSCTPWYEAGYAAQDMYEAFRYGHTDTFWVNPTVLTSPNAFRKTTTAIWPNMKPATRVTSRSASTIGRSRPADITSRFTFHDTPGQRPCRWSEHNHAA